jgi:gliding motility-associated-like protein
VNEAPTLDGLADMVLCSEPTEQILQLTGISAGEDVGQITTVEVTSDKQELFSTLAIADGKLRYRLKEGASGLAKISITVKDNGGTDNGGTNSFTRIFALTVKAAPQISIASDLGMEVSKGREAILKASGGTKYIWESAEGILSGTDAESLTIRPRETTTYRVTVISESGCSATSSIQIKVKDDYSALEATNILSPNSDGTNDMLVIKNIDMYPNNVLKVFDRAGRLIYSKKNYANDWDGTFDGAPLAQDTYFYVVDFGPEVKEKLKGFVTIVR